MFIKNVVLDGFKSYGKRMVLSDLDKEFNAITGLNGTGKSNILDSICFVLGISNLKQVRAGTLQELIYKNGQAGVDKASVTIIFDNRNPDQSPPGFEMYHEITITRQVIMGGKSKYWINGILVQTKKVNDFFCSIQLNVNNPHFLIMQGRVTKVLNMKPHEILAMMEEAAGTRMYETKRQAAQKTIEKKDAKLIELNAIFNEEVSPKLEKLRMERQSYLEYLRIERELEHMTALCQAWMYYATKRATERAEHKLGKLEDKVKNIQNDIEKNKATIDEVTNEIMLIAKEAEEASGGKIKEMQDVCKAKEQENAKATAAEKAAKEAITSEEKKIKMHEKHFMDDEALLASKEKELGKVQDLFQSLKENDERDNAAFMITQKKFEAVSAGMDVNEDGEAQTLQEQLMTAKQEAVQASTEMKTANMEVNHCQSLLKEKEKDLGSKSADFKRDKAVLDNAQKEVQILENSLSKLNYSEERMQHLQEQRRLLSNEVRVHREKVENFEGRRPYTKFNYRDPEPNFRRDKVRGVVCKLIELHDPVNSTALETAAGGRLYNVIVDDDHTSKILLQKGQLQSRTTFIPLNKIQGGRMNDKTIKLAQDLVGKENVQPALSLIKYDKKLQPAMEYIFGNVFICKDMNVAKQVTFHDRIQRKCVTLEGDVTDPGGTLSGGARQKGTPVLLQVKEIQESELILKDKGNLLTQIEKEMQQMMQSQQQYEQLKQRLEIKSHELEMVKNRLQQTTHHQQQQEVDGLKEKIVHLRERLEQCKVIEEKNVNKANDLESKMKDTKGHRDRELKAAEKEMNMAKAKADKSRKEWEKREQEFESLNLEISELKKAAENTKTAVSSGQSNVVKFIEEHEEAAQLAAVIKAELHELQNQLKGEKVAVANKNKDIQKKQQHKEKLAAQNSEFELEIKKQDHEIKKAREEFSSATKKEHEVAKSITKKDDKNLKDAKELSDKDGQDLQNKIAKAQEKRSKLGRTVNTKAQSMFEHEEKQYNALIKKKAIVESDKKKLLLIMSDLDKKKKEAIELAYNQVKRDFGSIFGTLLPDANATLKAPEGKSIVQGLEVKVSLGGVWKESLTELSGGQRSLVALSLILAMLLFKPAPLYILDEVDAALDLSHTQNIGNMLKTHFKQSQFIIVSLKDGMFNNANVLFRTKFIDGMSTISRKENTANH